MNSTAASFNCFAPTGKRADISDPRKKLIVEATAARCGALDGDVLRDSFAVGVLARFLNLIDAIAAREIAKVCFCGRRAITRCAIGRWVLFFTPSVGGICGGSTAAKKS